MTTAQAVSLTASGDIAKNDEIIIEVRTLSSEHGTNQPLFESVQQIEADGEYIYAIDSLSEHDGGKFFDEIQVIARFPSAKKCAVESVEKDRIVIDNMSDE